jgi:hypothetical protein
MRYSLSYFLLHLLLLVAISEVKGFCATTLHYCIQLLPKEDENLVIQVLETIKEAAVPLNVDGAISIGLAEAVAGAIGGFASRSVRS